MIHNNLLYRATVFSCAILLLSAGMNCREASRERPASIYEHTTLALDWFQTSAECRALYYQAFNTARIMLDDDLRSKTYGRKRAIVFDIDGTLLDDSPHSVMLLKANKLFPYRYDEWIEAAKEEALPGALEFAQYAASRNVDIFYISNRTTKMLNATVRNLKSAGFPQAEESHVLLMGENSSKEDRRKSVATTHEIVLLLGDNLNDLSNVFESKNVADRSDEVDKVKAKFGSKYIVLPNPVYGAWESAVYDNKSDLSEDEKDAKRKSVLRSF